MKYCLVERTLKLARLISWAVLAFIVIWAWSSHISLSNSKNAWGSWSKSHFSYFVKDINYNISYLIFSDCPKTYYNIFSSYFSISTYISNIQADKSSIDSKNFNFVSIDSSSEFVDKKHLRPYIILSISWYSPVLL